MSVKAMLAIQSFNDASIMTPAGQDGAQLRQEAHAYSKA
jgi:hypothetical protein